MGAHMNTGGRFTHGIHPMNNCFFLIINVTQKYRYLLVRITEKQPHMFKIKEMGHI